ncbi:MAG: DNA repair protein RecO [Candidatus Desulforudis sp.]|nr:DNA repair protein RecO [Desulforudis sp.]
MKLYQTEAIVLRASPVRDADRVLVLFSPECGRLRVWAHGASRPTSRKRGAVQPLCRSRFLLERGREIDVIRQAEAVEEFSSLHDDLETFSLASYLCELVEGFTPEGQPNARIYLLLLRVLRRLAGDRRDLLVRFFESRLLALSGLRPELDVCTVCGECPVTPPLRFSPHLGGVLCGKCRADGPQVIPCRPATVQVLAKLLDWPLDRLGRLRTDAATEQELAAVLQASVCYQLEYEPKSLVFLRKLRG